MTLTPAERQRRYRQRDVERFRANQAAYRSRHRERLRVENRERERDRRERIRAEVIAALGGCCQLCGFDDIRALDIDHVNNDGQLDKKEFGANWQRFKQSVIAEAASGRYQLLCCNCNRIKEIERRMRSRL